MCCVVYCYRDIEFVLSFFEVCIEVWLYIWGEELKFLWLYWGDKFRLEDWLFIKVKLWLFVNVVLGIVVICLCEILYVIFVCYRCIWKLIDVVNVGGEEIGVGFDY